jgi:hypothetical protein
MRAKLSIALGALAAIVWAVPDAGAAHFYAKSIARTLVKDARTAASFPLPARFRLQKETGLLLRVWLNHRGPYIFAIDTGAGLNVITEKAAGESRLQVRSVRSTLMGGLSAARISSNRETVISQMSIGDRGNTLPLQQTALIVPSLAPGIDGILDPTDAYSPYGYSIDISNERIEAIDTNASHPAAQPSTSEGAVVPWLRVGESDRPFVRLGDGRVALVDTGSSFGLAVSERSAVIISSRRRGENTPGIRDIGGGTIFSRRVSPSTISIGDLVLRGIPTDILSNADDDVPLILGRDALYPFRITFDPRRRLIEFVTSANN